MIRQIDIRLNAAHPELPLCEAVTYTGAPSAVMVRGVPGSCGRWAITSVFVAASYPDGSTTTRAAVQDARGVLVATLPATATSGRTANGLRILADGVDENGDTVTGYILGVADFAVCSLDIAPAPAPGETSYQMLYFDDVPAVLRKGDVAKIDGVLKFYNGESWEPFADLSDYYTAEQVDEAIDKLAAYYITADAQGNPFATHAALVNAQTYYSGGAVRTPTRNDYAVVSADETHGGAEWRYIYAVDAQGVGQWEPQYAVEGVIAYDNAVTRTSANGVKSSGIWSAIWGALSALPTGFSSLYGWCVAQLAGKVPTSRTVNGKALTGNVTLTGADIAVSGSDTTKINAALGAKADKTNLVSEFEAFGGYGVGDLCVYENHIYKCVQDYDGELFDAAYFVLADDVGFLPLNGGRIKGKLAVDSSNDRFGGGVALVGDGYSLANILMGVNGGGIHGVFSNGILTAICFKPNAYEPGITLRLVSGGTSLSGTTAFAAPNPTAGHLAALDANGNPTDSTIPAVDVALKSAIPYSLAAPIVVATAYSETVEGETVYYGSETLADRTANIIQVTAATPLDELRITFPSATSGKVRDFGLRVEIGTGSAALAAPALVPIEPHAETIKIENADGTIPALADGTATAKGVTLLYFSETAPGVFLVKGEQVEEVA